MTEKKYNVTEEKIYCGTYTELLKFFKEVLKVKPNYDREDLGNNEEGAWELSPDSSIEAQLTRIKCDCRMGKVMYVTSKTKTTNPQNVTITINAPFVYIRDEEAMEEMDKIREERKNL